jgi:hypothetical protein
MDYREFIEHDDLTGLDYINWTDYLDNKDLFLEDSKIKENILQLIINSNIVLDIYMINQKLISIYYAIEYIFSETDFNDKYYILWREKISDLYFDLENEYNYSRNKESSWKYIDLTLEDLYNRLCKNYKFALEITLDKLFSEGYYIELMQRNMEETNND